MDQLNSDLEALLLDDASTGSPVADEIQSEAQKARILLIQRCIQCLLHVVLNGADCTLPSCPRCQKMKRVVAHAKVCPKKTNGGCPICKQLISLCCYHTKNCFETGCKVPFCDNIKQKLGQK